MEVIWQEVWLSQLDRTINWKTDDQANALVTAICYICCVHIPISLGGERMSHFNTQRRLPLISLIVAIIGIVLIFASIKNHNSSIEMEEIHDEL
jgi:hypothetical protein